MAITDNNSSGTSAVVYKIDCDVVASQVGELREQLRRLVADGVSQLVLDLEAVRMVDSAGLGMIIAAHNSLRKANGELVLANCSPDILELFHSMRIHQHIRIEGAGVATT